MLLKWYNVIVQKYNPVLHTSYGRLLFGVSLTHLPRLIACQLWKEPIKEVCSLSLCLFTSSFHFDL